MFPLTFLAYLGVFDVVAVVVAIYCAVKAVADFRAGKLGIGLWGAASGLACLCFAASLWIIPYFPFYTGDD